MDSLAALHAHERRSLLSGMRPLGPSLNGLKTVFSWPTATKEKKGRPSFGSSLPSTAIGQTPRGSAASESARERRNPPKRCQTALRDAWNDHDRGVVAEGRPTVRQQHALGKGCCCFLFSAKG
ncbi:hypothetical protein CXB51_022396 [Gossypium anomalum]|uniref:Uncharacterized protein n=1 Tax=Gossypium anomalum TaxID=47600 RepID=A0A8J6CXD9_9ROSI|nr:hypothetical protein CXB51_022396 [Gossypium anomalum]